MSFKINLDQIFASSTTEDLNNNSCYQSEQSSESGSHSSYLNRYKIKAPIFDEPPSPSPSPALQSNINVKSPFSKASSVISVQTQFSDKMPGERLYYESKNNVTRKIQQMERIKLEKVIREEQQATFKPKINKNSQKILQYRAKYPPKNKKKTEQIVPTRVRKEQQQINQCTFKPELIAKSTSGVLRHKQKDKFFQQLFNDHKIKQVKKRLRAEEVNLNQKNQKKLTKAQFDNFLTRNNEFINKVQKKNELILSTSSKFDLQTGHKMFSPRTNTFKSHKNYFGNKTQQKSRQQSMEQNKKQIQTKSIFAKKYENYEEQQSTKFEVHKNDIFRKNKTENDEQIQFDFGKIHEAQDEEQQISDQLPQYQTVKGFKIQSEDQQRPSDKATQEKNQIKHQNSKKSSKSNSLKGSRSKKMSSQNKYENQHDQNHFQNESPIRDQEQKNSDEGRTHHEGEQSRCNDPQ